jgi:nucleotide-binding universal stress UspA family protein
MDVVCGTDFSLDAKNAAETAGSIAARTGGKLVLVHGMELPTIAYVAGEAVIFPASVLDTEKARRETNAVLDGETRRVADLTGAKVEGWLDVGAADTVVLGAALRAKAGLIVVGSHGRRAPIRWILGSTAERLTATSPVPVLVTRGEPAPLVEWGKSSRTLRVLVAADFDESFAPAARFVTTLFEPADRVEIHVAHAIELPIGEMGRYPYAPPIAVRRIDVEGNAQTELRRHVESAGLTLRSDTMHLVFGKAAPSVARFAQEGRFDLVVAGTHGRHGLDRALLGSVAHGLLRRSAMPVLVVPLRPKRES